MDPSPSLASSQGTVPIFCSLIPRELLSLAGLEWAELRACVEPDRTAVNACALCENLCSWARHLVGRLAGSEYPLVVVPTSCDAMAKLHDVLRSRHRSKRIVRLHVPRQADRASVGYLASQYADLLHSLGVTDDNFEQAAARAGKDRREPTNTSCRSGRPRVGLAGSVYPEALFRDALRAAGAEVETIRRCGMAVPGSLPAGWLDGGLDAACHQLAAHYLRSAACPRMLGTGFADYLVSEVKSRALGALVVPVLKFCDFYHVSVDATRKRLPAGFPVLVVEGDLAAGFGEQAVTRLEAFMEPLRAREATAPAAFGDAGFVVGVDVGSTQVKAVLVNRQRDVVCTSVRPTTGRVADASSAAVAQLLARAGIERRAVITTGVTGYGRKSVAADAIATEISCHARGVACFFPEPATVIDVGGQDCKVIVTDGSGRVVRFAMNDKCAAGTGRFIEGMIRALDLDFTRFSSMSLEAEAEVPVTSMCSVFAESEVVSLSSRGEPLAGIVRGINASIARRLAGMVRRVAGVPPFVLTGGVSQISGFVRELERELDAPVRTLEHSLHAGAVGAAMLALEAAP